MIRFSKRLRLFPGVTVNFAKRGASLTVGPKGAKVNLSARGVSATVSAPGTGLSWRQRLMRWGSNGKA